MKHILTVLRCSTTKELRLLRFGILTALLKNSLFRLYSTGMTCTAGEGFNGLMPKTREDKGHSRKLTKDVKNKIIDVSKQLQDDRHFHLSKTDRRWRYIEKRCITFNSIKIYCLKTELNRIPVEDMRAFEMEHSNDMWQMDTTYCSYINDDSGHKLRTYLIMIIDDHSRMIVGYGFFSRQCSKCSNRIKESCN